MRKHFILLISLLVFSGSLVAQFPLYELPLDQKMREAAIVIEGKVKSRLSFWNESHTLIHTAWEIEVYKVFKGGISAETVELVTEGGILGLEMHKVDPGLELGIGEVGVFFCLPARVKNPESTVDLPLQLMPYGGVQGYIHYDKNTLKASAPFHHYDQVGTDLYVPMIDHPEAQFQEIQPYTLGQERARMGAMGTRATPVVSSFTPTSVTAGTDSVITISGSNFEAFDGGTNSVVLFANANDGGSTMVLSANYHIVSWTTTEIQVRVPSGAGTGLIAVRNASGSMGVSGSPLSVTYNLSNVLYSSSYYQPYLQDDNGAGGYDLLYSTNTSSNGVDFSASSAVDPFVRALNTWQCETMFNVEADGTTTTDNTVAANSAPNIVMFDNDAAALSSGTLGVCYSGYGSCDGTTWYVNGFDIVFRRDGTGGINWNFGAGATTGLNYDFESVALHELGHGHGLGHIIAPGAVMHYSIANASDQRVLDVTVDTDAGLFKMSSSAPLNTCGSSVTGMTDYACVLLPLRLELAGLHTPEGNELHWHMEGSDKLEGLEVQKFRIATDEFVTLANPSLKQHCPDLCEYQLLDRLVQGEESRYRLKFTEINGKAVYSDAVVLAHPDLAPSLIWRADPASELLSVFLSSRPDSRTQFRLMDVQGRIMSATFTSTPDGRWETSTASWPNGVFLLQVSDPVSGWMEVEKVVINR